MNIQVLGPGCPKCTETEKIVKTALQEAEVEATEEKVSDFQGIAYMGGILHPGSRD